MSVKVQKLNDSFQNLI